MSDSYSYSLAYCRKPAENLYINSKLPRLFSIISLTENAAVPKLNPTPSPREFTLRDDQAIITRVLFINEFHHNARYYNVGNNGDINTIQQPPNIPSIRDIMNSKFSI